MTSNPTETARDLLDRHGLPEDVIDGALCLHAQELAALQRAVIADDSPAWVKVIPDLIDPTLAAPAVFPEPPSRAAIEAAAFRAAANYVRGRSADERYGKASISTALCAVSDELYRRADDAADPSRVADEEQPAEAQRPCPTPCDPDCAAACHEVHQPPRKRDHQPNDHAAGAQQQPETEARPVSLATPCILCQHPFNWHDRKGCQFGNEVNRCGCRAFSPGEKPAPVDPRTILGIAAPVEPAAADSEETPRRCDCPNEDAVEHQFGTEDCTCIPFTRQTDPPRYLNRPTDTVDMISGWERGRDCPHHRPAAASS